MATLKSVLTLWLVLILLVVAIAEKVVPTNSSSIDSALSDLRSGTTLNLEPGLHLISKNHFQNISNTFNVSIIGSGIELTIVRCADGYGLAFLSVNDLTLENFTITDCGMTGNDLMTSVDILNGIVDLFHLVPPATKVALLLGNCENVMIQNMHITNTTGLGFLGINVMGNSVFDQVRFTQNIQPKCNATMPIIPSQITPETFDQVGGGAYFLYTDYDNHQSSEDVILLLQDAYFAYNADCTHTASNSINYQYYSSNGTGLYNYAIGAGGGLSVIIASSHFAVNVTVMDSEFYRNDARYGGGAYIATFAGFQTKISISFVNCSFRENGMHITSGGGNPTQGYCKGGAGMAFFTDLVKPVHLQQPISPVPDTVGVVVQSSRFLGNAASDQGGGMMVYSLFNTPHFVSNIFSTEFVSIIWLLKETIFENNIARYSSAAHFTQIAANGVIGTAVATFFKVSASRNGRQLHRDVLDIAEEASAFHLDNFIAAFVNSSFTDNLGSALRMQSSVVVVPPFSFINFLGNTARRGGALYISDPPASLALNFSSSLKFVNNRALIEGGAIFVTSNFQTEGTLQSIDVQDCFISPPNISSLENPDGSYGLFTQNISISFRNNSAPAGGIIFGSTQENCVWARNIPRTNGLSLFQTLYRNYRSTFDFGTDPDGLKAVSSDPASLNISILPTEGRNEEDFFPGQVKNVEIDVHDQFSNTISAVVRASVFGEVSANATLGDSGFWHTSFSVSELSLNGTYRNSLNVTILTVVNSVSSDVSVRLLDCPIGFVLHNNSTCICHNKLSTAQGVRCSNDLMTFVTFDDTWIGINEDNATTDDLIVHRCIWTYCASFRGSLDIRVIPPYFDSQCASNRTGFLCSKCSPGYSRVFGTEDCVSGCTFYSLLLIPLFAVVGAIGFALVLSLKFTVNNSLPNTILLSSGLYACFLASLVRNAGRPWVVVYPRIVVLQFGISTCFYPGMTIPQRSLILLVFPLYMFVLVGVYTLLHRRSKWIRSWFYEPSRIFVSMFFICYFSILNTCVTIVMPTLINTIGGRSYYSWLLAPHISYSSPFHVMLTILAFLFILGYLIPFPVMLLCPPLVKLCGKKVSLLFDIAWESYKPKFRFWQGARVALIGILFLLTQNPTAHSPVFSGVVIACFLSVQTTILPFKDKVTNYLDVAVITMTSLYYWSFEILINNSLFNGLLRTTAQLVEIGLVIAIPLIHLFIYSLHCYRYFVRPSRLKALLYSYRERLKERDRIKQEVAMTVVEIDPLSQNEDTNCEERNVTFSDIDYSCSA